MKTRLLGALVGLAISFTLPTFAQEKETVDPKILEQLDAGNKKFGEAFNNNDAAAVAAFFTEDAIWVTRELGSTPWPLPTTIGVLPWQ